MTQQAMDPVEVDPGQDPDRVEVDPDQDTDRVEVDPGFDLVTRYDVAPDGRFLAMLTAGDETASPLVLVQNWRETLKK